MKDDNAFLTSELEAFRDDAKEQTEKNKFLEYQKQQFNIAYKNKF